MPDHELSFYRDLHRVAFFVLAAGVAVIAYTLVSGLLTGSTNGFIGGILIGLVLLTGMNFLGRRGWPARHATMTASIKAQMAADRDANVEAESYIEQIRAETRARRAARKAPQAPTKP